MKILYAIQGTGNGHLSRAGEILPFLQSKHEVDILISGSQVDLTLPFPVKYQYRGLGFVFGAKGGIDIVKTYKKNNLKAFFSEINELPVHLYDLVISDFEPVSAWACYQAGKPCIGMSHQSAVLNKHAPQPKHSDIIGMTVLKKYAPTTVQYGFHFKPYDHHIYTPVIRQEVRKMNLLNRNHYTVYLPAYGDDRIIDVLSNIKNVQWQVFSKHNKEPRVFKNVSIQPIQNEAFIKSMATSTGVLCGAGFETPAEALYMKKKLMVIPMKGQYEQQCNAAALKDLGVPVIKSLKQKHIDKIAAWVSDSKLISVDYPDQTAQIIQTILAENSPVKDIEVPLIKNKIPSAKKLRNYLLKKIAAQY